MPQTPTVSKDEIIAGLKRVGLKAGCGVMVHSSLKAFGRGVRARTIIEALMEVVTPEGTIMMPSFNHGAAFKKGKPGYFDPLTTPTTNGVIPELFWRQEGVCRSLNPTHAYAAWGKNARRYTENHHRTLTMGPESPLGLMAADGGYVMLMGTNYHSDTYHHVAGSIHNVKCLSKRTEAMPVKLPDGRMVEGRTWRCREGQCPIFDVATPLYTDDMSKVHVEEHIGPCRVWFFRMVPDSFDVISNIIKNGIGGFGPCSKCTMGPGWTDFTTESDWDEQNNCLKPNSPAWEY